MDINDSSITRERLIEIEQQLIETIINSYRNQEISYIELRESSKYILSILDTIVTHAQLVEFLKNLATRWTIFTRLATIESAGEQSALDNAKIDEIKNLIKTL